MKRKYRGMVYIDETNKWELLEKVFSLPVEERMAYLMKQVEDKKADFLGYTDRSLPELATELIKKGVKARSFVKGNGKKAPVRHEQSK